MKLRRAMAAVAASAVIAPAVVLTTTAAHATEKDASVSVSSSPSPSVSESAPSVEPSGSASGEPGEGNGGKESKEPGSGDGSGSPSPSDESSAPEEGTSSSPAPSGSGSPTPSPSTSEGEEEEPGFCEEDPGIEVAIKGLPGKIAAGSGWHTFELSARNDSKTTLTDLVYFAGASADKDGEKLFRTKQIKLQAYDPDARTWRGLEGPNGETVGFVGWSDELKPGHRATIPLRIDVTSSAPAGSAFSLGVGLYTDSEANCEGFSDTAYRFQIVTAGTDTGGTKPQEGGKVPVPPRKPKAETQTSPRVTGALAATGSSSVLPTIGLVGGVAVVAGAGVVFAVKRRRSGESA
ncbi:hypothetical protein ACFVIM_15270 [Streptomyces sp. NPDC057638]|uniref:hypothetical protein n=1 Tax=Streptomyces sp. NPDC057638 TaxID=3346190 RepID=UPI00368D57DD